MTADEIRARLRDIAELLEAHATMTWLLQSEQTELRQTLRSINARADAAEASV
jgi:hypothetical protein